MPNMSPIWKTSFWSARRRENVMCATVTEMASKKVAFTAPREESRARETGANVSASRSLCQMPWPGPIEARCLRISLGF